jgi:biotin operon repressor
MNSTLRNEIYIKNETDRNGQDEIREIKFTKMQTKLLRTLKDKEYTNQELANKLNTSANALSNMITRIKHEAPGFLVVKKEGKNVYYSLSQQGLDYLAGKIENLQVITDYSSSKFFHQISDLMKELQDELEEDFGFLFFYYLMSESISSEDDIYTKFGRLLDIIMQLIINEEGQEVEHVFSYFEKPVRKILESRFKMAFRIHDLCIYFEKQSNVIGNMIETFFDNRLRGIRPYPRLENAEEQEENVLIELLTEIVDNAEQENLNREKFKQKWKEYFTNSEILLNLLAANYGCYRSEKPDH